jgi:hypothetical protein
VTRAAEPSDAGERELLLGWLSFHRDALAAKCDGLSPDELVAVAALPSRLTLLGLVRHLTEMERVYAAHALGPPGPLHFVYGDYEDDGPEWDFDVDASLVEESLVAWERERAAADEAIAARTSMDDDRGANGRSLRWNLLKLIGEYARHNGHADLLRERIDGVTGE